MADRNMQLRKEEILAKKAKLAELKRQRELRQREFSQNRMSVGESSEVGGLYTFGLIELWQLYRAV